MIRNSAVNAAERSNRFTQHQRELDAQRNHVEQQRNQSMSMTARFLIFLVCPTCVGFMGLLMSYLDKRFDENFDENDGVKFDLDKDFIYPFILTLAVVSAIGFHTNGFRGDSKASPLISWPKVRKKKKIIHKIIVVDENGREVIESSDENQQSETKVDSKKRV